MSFNNTQFGSDFAKGFVSQIKLDEFLSPLKPDFQTVFKTTQAFGEGLSSGLSKGFHDFNSNASWSMLRTWGPVLLAFGVIGTAVPLAYHYIYECLKEKIGKPKMAVEQRRTSIFTPITSLFSQAQTAPKTIFNEEITEKINDIAASTKNIKKNNAYFQNVILFGPPGTGKTMVAKQIAQESDMDFIMMSAGNLTQFIKRKEHVTELNRLLDSAEKGWKPTVIFIDEAEGMAKDRGELDNEHVELLDTLLSRTGTPSKKVMLILATNRIGDIDEAVLSRMSHKIEITKPELAQRFAIIQQYANQLFADPSKYFNPTAIRQIAMKTDGLAGRELFNMVNAIYASDVRLPQGQILSQEKIDRIVDSFIKQEKNLKKKVQ